MPVEVVARRTVRERKLDTQVLPAMAQGRVLPGPLACRSMPSMMRWRGSPGSGRAWMEPWSKLPLRRKQSGRIRRTGGKKGTKRHILVDGRGVPLSLTVTGANRHDVTQLTGLLAGIVVALPRGRQRFLYADKGYDGEPARNQICWHGYTPRVCAKEAQTRASSEEPTLGRGSSPLLVQPIPEASRQIREAV